MKVKKKFLRVIFEIGKIVSKRTQVILVRELITDEN